MKKKIKDLTLGQLHNICVSHFCPDCPLYGTEGFCQIAQHTLEYDKYEEREVEVDE